MDLTPYLSRVEEGLAAASALGDENTQRVATALASALEPAVRLAIMGAMGDMALEVTDALGDRVVEVRLEGADVRVVVSAAPSVDDQSQEAPLTAGGELSRITLRLPEEVKVQAERAAAAQGISLNTWLSRAAQQALRGGGSSPGQGGAHRGHRVRGWVQA
jgi:predicted HicB family RNase H-like nuclease